jgi:hypothetical protein
MFEITVRFEFDHISDTDSVTVMLSNSQHDFVKLTTDKKPR